MNVDRGTSGQGGERKNGIQCSNLPAIDGECILRDGECLANVTLVGVKPKYSSGCVTRFRKIIQGGKASRDNHEQDICPSEIGKMEYIPVRR
jgi:hypothetical protein